MIASLLIANRGEIARRIIRTARALRIRSIAIYSEADAHMPFVREADEALPIGGAAARDSYLAGARIIEAARRSGAEAIHPGYGFLSENAAFAEAVQAAGLVWVGAPPAAIRAMGLKDAAKQLMMAAGVPVTPGYMGPDQSPARLEAEADAVGYPVLIKAVAGGGGKGMRRVDAADAFADALVSCRREAAAAFGDDRVLIEKYIRGPRHIEVQVFGDMHGSVVHLFERDCSLQRRHQKVLEEAPAPGMDAATREAICATAVRAARAVDYVGAGTIEFIADASEGLRPDRIWFMEMNTRLQVEHPVTEAITGEDLVAWQLLVASGERLPKRQDELLMRGSAIEARLYAEHPASGFLPSIGRLDHLRLPADIRVDSGVEEGDEITPHYDPMIAKLIAWAPTRTAALTRLAVACRSIEVWPVRTNAAFLARTVAHPAFAEGAIDTGFIERYAADLVPAAEPDPAIVEAAADALLGDKSGSDPWDALIGFRLGSPSAAPVAVEIGGGRRIATVTPRRLPNYLAADMPDGTRVLFKDGEAWAFSAPVIDHGARGTGGNADGSIVAPMPGRVIALAVVDGEPVTEGQKLITLEAMKMELSLAAPFDGILTKLAVAVGDQVAEGTVLARIEAAAS